MNFESAEMLLIELHFRDLLVPASPAGDSDHGLEDEAAALTTDDDDIRSNDDEKFEDATYSADVALPPQTNRPADVQQGSRRAVAESAFVQVSKHIVLAMGHFLVKHFPPVTS